MKIEKNFFDRIKTKKHLKYQNYLMDLISLITHFIEIITNGASKKRHSPKN